MPDPLAGVNVPVLLQLPCTDIVLLFGCSKVPLELTSTLPLTVRFLLTVNFPVKAPPIVSDLQLADTPTTGELAAGKLTSPISTSTVAVGTPLLQLDAVAQLVLVVPLQLVCANRPVLSNKNRLTSNEGRGLSIFFIYIGFKKIKSHKGTPCVI